MGTEFCSGKVPWNRLRTVPVILRKKVLILGILQPTEDSNLKLGTEGSYAKN